MGRVTCDVCDLSLCTKGALRGHKKSVHGQSSLSGLKDMDMDLKCNKCEFSAFEKEDLRAHFKELHMKSKPIKCSQCPTGFTTKSALRTHVNVLHKGMKWKKCPRCLYKARYRHLIDKHMTSCQGAAKEQVENVSDSPKKEEGEEKF